jgi:hypothetical protein
LGGAKAAGHAEGEAPEEHLDCVDNYIINNTWICEILWLDGNYTLFLQIQKIF